MSWQGPVRRASGLLTGVGLLGVIVGAILYVVAGWLGYEALAGRSVPFAVAGLFVGVLGSLGLLVSADRLPPGGGPGL